MDVQVMLRVWVNFKQMSGDIKIFPAPNFGKK